MEQLKWKEINKADLPSGLVLAKAKRSVHYGLLFPQGEEVICIVGRAYKSGPVSHYLPIKDLLNLPLEDGSNPSQAMAFDLELRDTYFDNPAELLEVQFPILGNDYNGTDGNIYYIVHKDNVEMQNEIELLIFHSPDLSLEFTASEMMAEIEGEVDWGDFEYIAYFEPRDHPGRVFTYMYHRSGVMAYKPLIKVEGYMTKTERQWNK